MSGDAAPLRSSLRFEKGETIVIRDMDRSARLWTVAGPHQDGWLLTPLDGTGERLLFTHKTIFDHYVCGRITRLGKVHRELDVEEEMRVRRAWDGAPAWARAVAERRYVILRACVEGRSGFKSMAEAFGTVPARLVALHGARWADEDRKLRPVTGAGVETAPTPFDAVLSEDSPYAIPCERTMWRWHERCGGADADLRRLLPRWHLRGDGRTLFGASMAALMDDVIGDLLKAKVPMAVNLAYELIFKPKAQALLTSALRHGEAEGVGDVVAGKREVSSASAGATVGGAGPATPVTMVADGVPGVGSVSPVVHGRDDPGVEQDAGEGDVSDLLPRERRINPIPSSTTFWRRFGKVTGAEKTRAFKGHRQVRLDWGTYSEAESPPFYMHQVEADHSFINMHVKCDVTGRVLGRPWLTAIRERKTKVILGLHVTFLPPSWMSLSRAIAHAIWPKDLSGMPGLKHIWFCHGVFDWMLTDRGLDFMCDGLRQSGRLIGFEVGNLAGFSPWLKGGLERLFRTAKVQIFSYRDGTSAWRALKHYDPRARATMTLGELKAELVTWVVDKYLVNEHGSLGISPAERWAMEQVGHGPARPVGDFFDLRRLFCRIETRSIQKLGIEVDGLFYNFSPHDPQGDVLGRLKGRGGDNQWRVMIDPYDLRSVFLEDPLAGVTEDTWIEVPCTRPELSVNVTQPQHELHKLIAKLTSPREKITEDMLVRAKGMAEARLLDFGKKWTSGTAARTSRYRDDGSFLTPVTIMGPPPILSVSPTVDWGQAELDARTGEPLGLVNAQGIPIGRIGGPLADTGTGTGTGGEAMPQADPPTRTETKMPAPTDADVESLMAELMNEMENA